MKEQQIAMLEKALNDMRKLVIEERKNGIPTKAELEKTVKRLEEKHEAAERKLAKAKQQIKKRKSEIKEWKAWFASLTQDDTTSELQQLNSEIEWRGKDIAELEAKVAQLAALELEAEGDKEQAYIRLQLLTEGHYERPVEEDPRILGIQEDLEELKNA